MSSLTNEQLQEDLDLCGKASGHEWSACLNNEGVVVDRIHGDVACGLNDENEANDAALIARARTALPEYIKEVNRLRVQIKELAECIEGRGRQHNLDFKRLKIAVSLVAPEQFNSMIEQWNVMTDEHIGPEELAKLKRRVGNWSGSLGAVHDPDGDLAETAEVRALRKELQELKDTHEEMLEQHATAYGASVLLEG